MECKEYKHKDSFMLMEYRCETCGRSEFIWNSRDAVSPFCVSCQSCNRTMSHVNWQNDQRRPDFKPAKGMRYFAALTYERATELARKRVESAKGTPYELQGEEAEAMIESLTASFLEDCCSMDLKIAE